MSPSPKGKIPRPLNAFFIYRSFICERLPPPPPGTTRNQIEVSKMAGEMWRNESPEVKEEFRRQAAVAKAEHAMKYPDFKFGPTSKSTNGGPKKGKGTHGDVVLDAHESSYPWNFDKAVGTSQGLHYSPALPEYSGNDFKVYPDYRDAVFDCYPPPGDESIFPFNDSNVYPDHHNAGFGYYPPPDDESVFSREGAWLANEAQLEPQTVFGDEQESVLHTLQGLTFEQLMELYLSV